MPASIEIDEELYSRLAEAAAREGKDVHAYANEIIRVQLRELERAYQIVSAFDNIARSYGE
jgi:predicted DNA-binding protein